MDFGDDPAATYTVSEQSLEEAAANVVLKARQSITATGTFDFGATDSDTDGVLDTGLDVVLLPTNISLEMRTRNTAADGAGGIDIDGDTPGAQLLFQTQGDGTIILEAGDPVTGAELASLVAGNLVTAGQDVMLTARENVTVNRVDAGAGSWR